MGAGHAVLVRPVAQRRELARELDGVALRGLRVVELGCGLAVPSIAAARAGAAVLATDAWPEALALVARNAHANGVRIETARVDWAEPEKLVRRAPFDLVLAADVLYERASVSSLLSLLPRLAPEAWLADPGRPAADAFIEQAARRWPVETHVRGVVRIHGLGSVMLSGPTMNSSEPVGTIRALWRFPVKSMLGEELDAADLTEGGIVGDRAYAIETGRRARSRARSTRSCGPTCSRAGRRSSNRRVPATSFRRCGSSSPTAARC